MIKLLPVVSKVARRRGFLAGCRQGRAAGATLLPGVGKVALPERLSRRLPAGLHSVMDVRPVSFSELLKPMVMEIAKLNFTHLPNALHVQCATDIRDLVNKYGTGLLKVQAPFDEFSRWFSREDDSYKIVLKSELTKKKEETDQARDRSLRGLSAAVAAALHHYDPAVASAAWRLQALLETYNRPVAVAKLSYDAETAAITNLLQELAGSADVARIGLSGWVERLDAQNRAFDALAKAWNEEKVARPECTLREARAGVDAAYREIVRRVSAWAIVEGEAAYAPFIRELNEVLKHYAEVMARHSGRVAKRSDEEAGEASPAGEA
jgi:hypothetical protein